MRINIAYQKELKLKGGMTINFIRQAHKIVSRTVSVLQHVAVVMFASKLSHQHPSCCHSSFKRRPPFVQFMQGPLQGIEGMEYITSIPHFKHNILQLDSSLGALLHVITSHNLVMLNFCYQAPGCELRFCCSL